MAADPVTGTIIGAIIGAVSSLLVGVTLYAVRRASSHRDQTNQHGERLARIETWMESHDERLRRIEVILSNTSPGA
jgi:hypothetical protein